MATENIIRKGRESLFTQPGQQAMKRALDIAGSALGLLFLLPFFAVLAILIKLDSPGPVIYLQKRAGKGGTPFWIYKFRTMHHDGEELLSQTMAGNIQLRISYEQYQKLWDDPRLTRMGRWMRKTSLDELPQLLNVLRGEMSLVGPRPILPEQISLYGKGYKVYTCARPGMTGLWQVSGRNLLSFSERAKLDYIYIMRWSLAMDVSILLRTIWVVIRGEGAC